MFPDNIVQACTQQVSTFYKRKNVTVNLTNDSAAYRVEISKELKYTDGTNVNSYTLFKQLNTLTS